MDRTTRWLLGSGAALALLVGVVAYFTLTSSARAGRATSTVVVARQPIDERTLFTAANVDQLLTERELPREAVPEGALTNSMQVIGKSAIRPVVLGEILLDSPDRLVSGEGGTARPAASIPRDQVALTIMANESISVAGAVRPGDRVEVIATWQAPGTPPVTRQMFQDVRVFAVGPWQNPVIFDRVQTMVSLNAIPSSITLLLDYHQAVAVEHLLRTGGQLSLALRRFDQAGDRGIESITSDVLMRRYFGIEADPSAPNPNRTAEP
jgi:Flp pilus assembly protein CpaB